MSSLPNAASESRPAEPGVHLASADAKLRTFLILLTVVTGIVDAASYLRLGHVFVANMTGNVVFLGFAIAGAAGIDPLASIVAIAAFLGGARIGTTTLARASERRVRMLTLVTTTKAALLVVAVALAALLPIGDGAPARYALAAVLALAMGAQNAVARKLAIPDLTTTVLTMTLTALGSGGPGTLRRIGAVAAMLLGAIIGGLLVLRVNVAAALAGATVLVVFVAIASYRLDKSSAT